MNNSRNKTKFLILGLLSEQSLSGYEIKKIVDTQFSFFWSESFGQIYPQLKKLSEEKLIEELISEELENNKIIKKYIITDMGMNELNHWLETPVEKEVVRFEILLKMYFSNNVLPEVMLAHVKEFQRAHKQQQGVFKEFQFQLEKDKDTHKNHEDILMVLSFGQKLWNAYDEWCNDVISVLEERKK